MTTGTQILEMLCPEIKWTIAGDDYNQIIWLDGIPAITEKEFLDGFAKYDAWKIEKNKQIQSRREALLNRLGITQEEANLLLS